jgi:hypothetical protein
MSLQDDPIKHLTKLVCYHLLWYFGKEVASDPQRAAATINRLAAKLNMQSLLAATRDWAAAHAATMEAELKEMRMQLLRYRAAMAHFSQGLLAALGKLRLFVS